MFSIVLFLLLLIVFFVALWNSGKIQQCTLLRELTEEFDGADPDEYDLISMWSID